MNINLNDLFTFHFQWEFSKEFDRILYSISLFTISYIIISIILYYIIFYGRENAYIKSTKLPKNLTQQEDQTDDPVGSNSNQSQRTIKRVLLIIAHPDDECMFFGPTVVALAQNQNYRIFVLCLSKGENFSASHDRERTV